MDVAQKILDLGREFAGHQRQRDFDFGADLDLVAPDVPFPDRRTRRGQRERAALKFGRRARVSRIGRPEGVLRDGEAHQDHDQHEAGDQARDDDVARHASAERHSGREDPDKKQQPCRYERQCAILTLEREEEREQSADAADHQERQACEGCGQARIDNGDGDERQLRHHPHADHHAHHSVPESEAQERRQEDHEARRHRGFASGAVDGVVLGAQVEQLVEETEVDAQVAQHRPGDEGSCGEDQFVIGGENRGQEDREQAGQAEHGAVEELTVAAFDFVVDRLPKIEPREMLARELGDVGDRLAGLERDAEHVCLVALDALRHEADRRRDAFDAPGVEIRPDRSRSDDGITVGCEQAFERLVGLVGECEHHPVGTGARHRGANRHAARHAILPGGGFDLQAIAAAFVGFAEIGDFNPVLIVLNRDRSQSGGVPGEAEHPKNCDGQHREP